MTAVYRTVVTVHHELVHEAKSAGEADLVAMRLIGSQPGIREDQIAQVISRPLSVVEQLQRQNLTAWQESEAVKHEPAMFERWGHNLLPEEELREHVRKALFSPMGEFRRRRRMTAVSIPHPRSPLGSVQCFLGWTQDLEKIISWSTAEVPEMKRHDYDALARLEEAARLIADHPWLSMSPADCVSTHLREHVGTCSVCKRTVSQRSVLVTVQWAGRNLSREYAL